MIVRNRKAFHDYQILETMEAGIALRGTEVKSCRMRSVSLQDAFARVEKNQVFLYNMNVSPYSHGNIFNHTAIRPRVLLLHKREILRLAQKVREKGCICRTAKSKWSWGLRKAKRTKTSARPSGNDRKTWKSEEIIKYGST